MDKQQSTRYQDKLKAANNDPRFLLYIEDFIAATKSIQRSDIKVTDINLAKKELLKK